MPQLADTQQHVDYARQLGTRSTIEYVERKPRYQLDRHLDALWLGWQLQPAFIEAEKQLRNMANLAPNWDSYGAEPPNQAARDSAIHILSFLRDVNTAPTRVVPSAEGGIAICFVQGSRYADIECLNAGETLAVTYRGKEDPHVWQVANADEEIVSAIGEIQAHFTR